MRGLECLKSEARPPVAAREVADKHHVRVAAEKKSQNSTRVKEAHEIESNKLRGLNTSILLNMTFFKRSRRGFGSGFFVNNLRSAKGISPASASPNLNFMCYGHESASL